MKTPDLPDGQDLKSFVDDLMNEPEIPSQDQIDVKTEEPAPQDKTTSQVVSTPKVGPKLGKAKNSNAQVVKAPVVEKETFKANKPEQLNELTQKFHKVFDKLLGHVDSDREKVENFINIYATQVQGETPKQAFVEGLVALLGIKAKIAADASKLLDTAAKMFTASKTMVDSKPVTPMEDLDEYLNKDFTEEQP